MNEQDLTSGLKDFFTEESNDSRAGGVVGGVGAWILHLVVFAFAIYSGYHGISATARYHGGGLGLFAGVVGILVIEIVIIGLYLAYFNRRITGDGQKLAAAATAGLGFVLSCLGIIGDSQMQAGMEVSNWLSMYLAWGLPIAPAFMALGAAAVMATEPKHLRLMAQAVKHEEFEQRRHDKLIAKKGAELQVAQDLANVQLNARSQAGRYILAAYRTQDVQEYVQRAALANMPELMRSIGVDLPYGTVIEGQTVAPLPPMPLPEETAAPPQEAAPRWYDRLPWRKPVADTTPTAAPQATPTPAPVDEAALTAAIAAMIARGELVVPVGNNTYDAMRHATDTPPAATGQGDKPNGPPAPTIGRRSPDGAPDF